MSQNDLRKALVQKFVKKEKRVWPRDMKVASTLIKRYPDPDFWRTVELGYDLNSLAFLLSERGDAALKEGLRLFRKRLTLPRDKPESVSVSGEKTGQDYVPNFNKPKNLKDFLNDK